MLLLLALMQTADPDEVVTGTRLFAKPECRRPMDGEILVCARRDSDRIAPLAAPPDPMMADRRPKVMVGPDLCLRIGFALTVSRC